MKTWKKASFTVEAAFLVPCAAIILAILIGYIYFMHETVCAKASSYEAGYYALQRTEEKESSEERMQERIALRSAENPLGTGSTQFRISAGSGQVGAAWSGGVLPAVFGDVFRYRGEAKIRVITPVKIKRMFWLAEYALTGLNDKEPQEPAGGSGTGG